MTACRYCCPPRRPPVYHRGYACGAHFWELRTSVRAEQPSLPAMYWASRHQIRNLRDRSRRNKYILNSMVSSTYIPSPPAKRTEKPTPACYNTSGKSARSRDREGAVGQATWRTSPDVPCRHSWRHVFSGNLDTCVAPGSVSPSPTKTNKIQRKTTTLSGV